MPSSSWTNFDYYSFGLTRDLTAGPLSSRTNIASGCFSVPTSSPTFSGLSFNLFVLPELGTIWDTEPHHPQQIGQAGRTVLTVLATCRQKEKPTEKFFKIPKATSKLLRSGTPLQHTLNRFPVLCYNASAV